MLLSSDRLVLFELLFKIDGCYSTRSTRSNPNPVHYEKIQSLALIHLLGQVCALAHLGCMYLNVMQVFPSMKLYKKGIIFKFLMQILKNFRFWKKRLTIPLWLYSWDNIETVTKKMTLAPKYALDKKSTIFELSLWNFVRITITWVGDFS